MTAPRQPLLTVPRRARVPGRARIAFALPCLLAVLAAHTPRAAAAAAAGAEAAAEERWSVFSIGGAPVGYAHERRAEAEGGDWLTESTLEATLDRLGTKVRMRFASAVRESAEGELEWLRSDVELSQQPVRAEAFVEDDVVRVLTSTGAGAAPRERIVERPGAAALLGPEAVRRLTAGRLRRPGDSLEHDTFSLELQRVVSVRRRVAEAGQPAPCAPEGPPTVRVLETVEGVPGERSLWVDASGETVADSIEGPFGPMATCRASREAALAAKAGGSPPAAMYERTIVRSNVRLADPTGVDRLVLRVRPLDPKRPLPDLAAHNQTVRADADAVRVEIRRPADPSGAIRQATTQAGAATTPAAEYLQPNAIVASDHPEIAALAREIAGEEREPWQVAQRLALWVAENLTLDLGVVMAPAGELVRDRRATCVGYATLLAALARASGIPSRLAMGAVYYGGIWGGHAWTEVWIDGRWLPLDAAVYAPGLASAARLAAGTSSLQDGGGELTARLGQMFGNVDIDVVEVEAAGRAVEVDPAGAAYTITDGAYANPGLGLHVAAPGWEVEDADSVWPSSLVVAFRRGAERVELHELPRAPAGRSLEAMRGMIEQGRVVLASPAGGTLWLHVASGPRPETSLRELLPALRMDR